MLVHAPVHPTLAAADLDCARRFYEQVPSFQPTEVLAGGGMYGAGDGTRLLVFPSSVWASGDRSQIGFTVSDLATEVAG
ncbi:MAG: hypothetical protein ACLQBX_20110 [Candidatus Limnocylindrales bacterium]|jgi:hypothetical protein